LLVRYQFSSGYYEKMKKQIALAFTAAALLCAAPADQKFSGTITEDMCGKDHTEMKMGPDPKCVAECVKTMHAKYALYDGKDVYVLSDQKTPAKFAAKKVTVTGTLDAAAKTIKVARIEAAK
jgi:hypothetical protein